MVTGFTLPPPPALEIHDGNVAEKWKKFRLAWSNYALSTELNKKSEPIQVATLLTVIGEDARDVYSAFDWDDGCRNSSRIIAHTAKTSLSSAKRAQEAGESYDQHKTALKKLTEGCEFDTITPEEI